MQEVRIGVIGVGGMGTSHANRLQQGEIKRGRLAAVCDINPDRMKNFGDQVAKFADSRELIRSGKVDAVIVATPHYGHTTIGADALEQGLHVLVEKPISVHKADAERLIAAYQRKDRIFAAMFNQRTDPRYRKMRDLVKKGELGEIRRVNWIITSWFRAQAYYDSGGWRATWKGEGGGVLLNQCPHQLDMLQWVCGMPNRVRAFCGLGKYHDIEVEDEVTAYLEFPNGATGLFVTSTGEAPGTNRFEICGDRGRLVCEQGKLLFTRNEEPVNEFIKSTKEGFSRPAVWNVEIPVSGGGGQHREIMENFVASILDGATLLAPAIEGIHSVELANSMLLSSLTDSVVEIPMDGDRFEKELQRLIRESKIEKQDPGDNGTVADLSASFQ